MGRINKAVPARRTGRQDRDRDGRREGPRVSAGALDALLRFVRLYAADSSEKWMIHIQDADCVQVLSDPGGQWDWTVRLTAVARTSGREWESGMTKEALSVCLQSQFQDTADRKRLLKELRNGSWQEESYWLVPYRTFPEIRQPGSEFILSRCRRDSMLLLKEADGGLWREEAISRICAYLHENLSPGPAVCIL